MIVTRTFSKGYSLAGLRLGYLIARPEIVAGLIKVKDSYNCDTLSLAGGAAALEDQDYLARDPREDPGDPPTADRRRPRARLPRPREPGQLRLVHRRAPRGRDLRGAQGPEDPRPPDALPGPCPTACGSPSAPTPRSTGCSKLGDDRRSPGSMRLDFSASP